MEAFQELKRGKNKKFIIFKISGDKTTIVVSNESNDADYNVFLEVYLNFAVLMEGTP